MIISFKNDNNHRIHASYMNQQKNWIYLTITVILFLSSCVMDKSDEVKPEVPALGDTMVVSYSKDVVPILQTYCYGEGEQRCHVTNTNQYAAFDFTICSILSDVAKDGLVDDRVFSPGHDMPPLNANSPQQLSDDALQILRLWIDQGANCD